MNIGLNSGAFEKHFRSPEREEKKSLRHLVDSYLNDFEGEILPASGRHPWDKATLTQRHRECCHQLACPQPRSRVLSLRLACPNILDVWISRNMQTQIIRNLVAARLILQESLIQFHVFIHFTISFPRACFVLDSISAALLRSVYAEEPRRPSWLR